MRNILRLIMIPICIFLMSKSNLLASDSQFFCVLKKRYAVTEFGEDIAFNYMPDKFVAKKLESSILLKWTFFKEKEIEMDNYNSLVLKNYEEYRYFKYNDAQTLSYNLIIEGKENKIYDASFVILPRQFKAEIGFYSCDKIGF